MKIYLTSLGCRLNEAELQTWAQEFADFGIKSTNELSRADLVVINTCAVTGEAARKSRQAIRRLHRKNSQAKLVVTGCYASLEKEQAGSILGVDLIVNNQDKKYLAERVKELLEWPSMPFAATEPDEISLFNRNRERAFVKIQDGCRYRCTYCIVTIARGDEQSRSVKDILHITGVHVGGYGADLGVSLFELTEQILLQTKVPRIRFASVEPWDLSDEFFTLFKNKRLMPHMHLPIQSGSDRILKKMSRRCKSETFLKLIKRAREVIPDFNITSDIIVGFPSETEEDFQQSLAIVNAAKFGHVHTFAYSKREGTKAANLPEQIDEATKKSRSRLLHKEALRAKIEVLNSMLDKTEMVLWEGRGKRLSSGNARYFGYTSNYHKVRIDVPHSTDLSNQILPCTLISVDEEGCLMANIAEDILLSVERLNILVR